MKSKQLILPRKDKEGRYYLSYSQISKWNKSKRDYIRSYFFGEEDNNPALQKYGDFGHKVGESYEHNDFSKWDDDEAKFLKSLPYYDEFEREIKLDMGSFYVLGFIDSNTKKEDGYVKKMLDYKTGEIVKRTPDYESDDYRQIHIYAAALEQEYKKLPDEACVVLIGRDGNAFAGDELTLSKEVAIIEKKLTKKSILETKQYIKEIAEEICSYYTIYLKLTNQDG